jgi:hypothetical protein
VVKLGGVAAAGADKGGAIESIFSMPAAAADHRISVAFIMTSLPPLFAGELF